MSEETKKLIMFDSDTAAQYRTNLSGWVSSNGRFWGEDERAARYDGCTHTVCKNCGKPTEKSWLICPDCRVTKDIAKYDAMPKEEWDGNGMLYSDLVDRYFQDWDQVEEFCEDEGVEIGKLRLIICEPHYLPLLDASDYGCDDLAEDGELPDTVLEAIDEFNKVIKAEPPISWFPGNKAAIIEES